MDTTDRNGSADWLHTREVYAVDDTRVSWDARHGWQCPCGATESTPCVHIAQAQVFRQMRRPRWDENENTIELEFNALELESLSRAAEEAENSEPAVSPAPALTQPARRPRWRAAAAMVAISALSSGVTYLWATRPEPAPFVQSAPAVLDAAPQPEPKPQEPPVEFVNPFDESEVFEFPPGTTEAQAREAVAEFLLERARSRMAMDAERARGEEQPVVADGTFVESADNLALLRRDESHDLTKR